MGISAEYATAQHSKGLSWKLAAEYATAQIQRAYLRKLAAELLEHF